MLNAEGGYFATNCTYLEFIDQRYATHTEKGNTTRFKELAECGGQAMPRTQDEMLQLLAREAALANQPQQIDFAL